MQENIVERNRRYWDEHADLWFGTTALPQYGVKFVTEDELHFFKDVAGKRVLEVCCGSGHSLCYLADRGAGELWGVDLSQHQLDNASRLLRAHGHLATLRCMPMEQLVMPPAYFDYVYSIYGIGWTTDLLGTFRRIAACLKQGGTLIFSWHHTLNYCVSWSCSERRDVLTDDQLTMTRSYFDEGYFTMPVHDSEITLCNRKISTYVNALAQAGFALEQMVEQNDTDTENADLKARKARMVPISMCFRARKL